MFFDEVRLELHGGRGGNGMVSFHREKFIAYGPPDGGDGGNGGSIRFVADVNYNTLRHFSGRKQFKADPGGGGHKNNRHGANGEDLVLKVPVGTLIIDEETKELVADLKEEGQEATVVRGGRGGYGNSHFVSSTRQAPKFAELGDVGEVRQVRVEMRLVADVGLVGFPSAGKSTLISHVSAAKPKIGAYPFTTLVPNLGVVYLSKFGGGAEQSFVIADMPGIIEGAAEGKGLGGTFLKHISRTALLVFLLDPFSYDDRNMVEQYRVLREELERYDKNLLSKQAFVAMNKIDAIPHEDREELKAEFLKEFPELKDSFHFISGVSGEALDDFLFVLWNEIQKREKVLPEMEEEVAEEMLDYVPMNLVDEHSFEIELMYTVDPHEFEPEVQNCLVGLDSRPERRLLEVKGKRIEQISRMTNLDQEGAVHRVYDVMRKMGIYDELRRAGAENGDYIKIGPHFYEYHDL